MIKNTQFSMVQSQKGQISAETGVQKQDQNSEIEGNR